MGAAMRLGFLTMVWRDHWLLEKWVAHNARIVPKRQLTVLNHGGDPEIDRIADGCNVIHIPRDEMTIDLTERRWQLLSGIANGMLAFFDRVVVTDVDEFLIYVGDKPDMLAHLASRPLDKDALAPVGLNMIPVADDAATEDMPILERFPNAVLSGRYTKPCIAGRKVAYTVGGHGLIHGDFEIDPDILLLHLHYITPDYRERMAARQEIVAESVRNNMTAVQGKDVPGRFWINWSQPDMIREKEIQKYQNSAEMDVSDGFASCAERLRAAKISRQKKTLIKAEVLNRGPVRVHLPPALRQAL